MPTGARPHSSSISDKTNQKLTGFFPDGAADGDPDQTFSGSAWQNDDAGPATSRKISYQKLLEDQLVHRKSLSLMTERSWSNSASCWDFILFFCHVNAANFPLK